MDSTMSAHCGDPLALAGVTPSIGRLPVENISSLAKGALGERGVIPLWFGEGDIPAPAFIGQAMARAVADGHVFYTHQNGIPPLREALAEYLTGLGGRPIAPERITATTSGMHAIMMAVRLTAEAGDTVVVIDPCWPNAGAITQVLGVAVRSVGMDHGPAGWTLDLDKVRAALDKTVHARFANPGTYLNAIVKLLPTQAAPDPREVREWSDADVDAALGRARAALDGSGNGRDTLIELEAALLGEDPVERLPARAGHRK